MSEYDTGRYTKAKNVGAADMLFRACLARKDWHFYVQCEGQPWAQSLMRSDAWQHDLQEERGVRNISRRSPGV